MGQPTAATADERWPALPYDGWRDTYATLHMWSQIVGKVALALAPPLNHCWGSALQLTAHGLSTRRLVHGERAFTMELDFVEHRLAIRSSDDTERFVEFAPRTVADFYGETMAVLTSMGLGVKIWPMPVEIPSPIRFTEDTVHRSYDPDAANRFWRIVAQVERILTDDRCRFVGKCSPTHFFWGSFDLAVTRFSGRPAPPMTGPAFMCDAYSHEVISHGFWPGSGPVLEPAFYAYAVPAPAGLEQAHLQPAGAFFHPELKEFILPYKAVRTAVDPEAAIRAFVDSSYGQAADLAHWDRAALERP